MTVGKHFNLCADSWRGFAEGLLQFVLFTVFYFKWSAKKHCVAKILQRIWERFLREKNRKCNSYKPSYKFTFIYFLSFHRNQKQESYFQQVGGLVSKNSFAFRLQRVAVYFKSMPNSIDFYKRIFLHVILARIIVPLAQRTYTLAFQCISLWPVLYYERNPF